MSMSTEQGASLEAQGMIQVTMLKSVRVDEGNGLHRSYTKAEVVAFQRAVAERLIASGDAIRGGQAKPPRVEPRPSALLMRVRFLEGTTVALESRTVHYGRDEIAGFDAATAQRLVKDGRAVLLPRSVSPLVEAAQALPNKNIRELADTLAGLGPTLETLREKTTVLREQVKTMENAAAKAAVLKRPHNEVDLREARSDLVEAERQIEVLSEQEPAMFDQLHAAVEGYVKGAYEAVLRERVAPVVKKIAGIIADMRPTFNELASAQKSLEDLRQVTVAAGLDSLALDAMETAALRDVSGDNLVALEGRARVPQRLSTLLDGISRHQERK